MAMEYLETYRPTSIWQKVLKKRAWIERYGVVWPDKDEGY